MKLVVTAKSSQSSKCDRVGEEYLGSCIYPHLGGKNKNNNKNNNSVSLNSI
jgi:hypothetical protein